MGKGTAGVPKVYGTAQEGPLTLREAGQGGMGQNITCGGLAHVAGRDGWLLLSYIATYITTPGTSNVTSLPDVGGLAVQGRRTGRHNGLILKSFFFSSSGEQRKREGLAECPHLNVMGHMPCKLTSSDCAAPPTLISTSEMELGGTKRWSRVRSEWLQLLGHRSHITHLLEPWKVSQGLAGRDIKSPVQDKGMWGDFGWLCHMQRTVPSR